MLLLEELYFDGDSSTTPASVGVTKVVLILAALFCEEVEDDRELQSLDSGSPISFITKAGSTVLVLSPVIVLLVLEVGVVEDDEYSRCLDDATSTSSPAEILVSLLLLDAEEERYPRYLDGTGSGGTLLLILLILRRLLSMLSETDVS